ncbi:MAG: hypothetical protein HY859_00950 [Caulobacterales bacterium]|nr:hypothetical protein [Caulobacterales bacterium]
MISAAINSNGYIAGMTWRGSKAEIQYPIISSGEWSMGVTAEMKSGHLSHAGVVVIHESAVEIRITAVNTGGSLCRCARLRYVSGFDMLMVKHPEYLEKFMPTTIRMERDHAWSVFGTPSGKWIALVTPNAIDGFEIHYDNSKRPISRNGFRSGGHQINTVSFDLINSVDKRPSRCGDSQDVFLPGESRTWTFYIVPLGSAGELAQTVVRYARVPHLVWRQSGAMPGHALVAQVFSPRGNAPEVTIPHGGSDLVVRTGSPLVVSDDVEVRDVRIDVASKTDLVGRDVPVTVSVGGRSVSANGYVFDSWDSYVLCASSYASGRGRPAVTKVCEASMPIFSLIGAQRIAPGKHREGLIGGFLDDELFQSGYLPNGEPRMNRERIQNHSCTIDICRETWLATRDERWLHRAVVLADYLMNCQGDDGGYYAFGKTLHYTCVYYIAKSLIELGDCLSIASHASSGEKADGLLAQSRKVLKSAAAAIEDLYRRGTDVGTEGLPCYEDGAISCAALQLALWSFRTGDRKYSNLAAELMEGHGCLEWRGPDATTNGATVRFWESFWALGWRNCLNTPHGWSAWTAYAWHSLYLSTGRIEYFERFTNTLASCLHLINTRQGELHFCFSPELHLWDSNGIEYNGERFLTSIRPGMYEEGGSETHEIIKLLMDTLLFQGYVYHDGSDWIGVNVSLSHGPDGLMVTPCSPRISTVYFNKTHQPSGCIARLSSSGGRMIQHGDP